MTTLTTHAIIGEDGHLRIDLPTSLPAGQVQVQVDIIALEPERSEPKRYDFSDLVGKLQWDGDAVAEQRRLRDEWPD
jgi:hypothetical protein